VREVVELPILGTRLSYVLNPQKIVAVGLNYREHVAESPSILADPPASGARAGKPAADEPREPILFAKTPNVLIGPGEPIPLPLAFLAASGIASSRTDYEAELAVVMGRRCKDVGEAEALEYVLGYTCFNDVSQRDIQNLDRSGWFRGKSFDGFGPVGPAIAPAEAVPDPQALAIRCRLNGELVQESSTARMIFGVARLVSYVSRNMTLEPGDLIATGTPSGVGPLSPGDVVEVEIEGIGTLSNPVVSA
jgi:2-keto-4-pentenoate hydratase/2-oxohepta-3-ene-1,7-dioic acid hydratase in catechol pathway